MCFIAQRSTLIALLEDTIYEMITVVNDLDLGVNKHLFANSETGFCQEIKSFLRLFYPNGSRGLFILAI